MSSEVYKERNQCVAAIARTALTMGCNVSVTKTEIEGWDDAWHNCVFIDLPTGQVSWHFHNDDMWMLEGLPIVDAVKWDGHSTPEKYDRLNAWLK